MRIIPTRVGTRRCNRQTPCQCQDHPHACGDKIRLSVIMQLRIGSSPRVWGQDFFDVSFNASYRIIPTRVGTRKHSQLQQDLIEDHPHACGDKDKNNLVRVAVLGSSPRVWGQAQGAAVFFCDDGIIPTRVGTSDSFTSDTPQGRDHPHACGDKISKILGVRK